jgi:N-acetyl-gamma-glutamyl-phosphate reductase
LNATSSKAAGESSAKPKIFIDGEAGTTGLEIRERLATLADIDVVSIDPAKRKDADARQNVMRGADLVVLCLPDDAAREAVALADKLGADKPRILDASTAHRIDPEWVYGFAELDSYQSEKIAHASRVANPGCYPTGAIALIRPLVDAGLLPRDYPVTINAVSGYSGGGRKMIEDYVAGTAPVFELYGLALDHKHVPEIETYSGLTRRPIFVPSVGNFRQGMLVSIPLHLDTLPGRPELADIEQALEERHPGGGLISVHRGAGKTSRLPAPAHASDTMDIFVLGDPDRKQAVLVARLDNLGKGAAGAAMQNIKLMLGLDGPRQGKLARKRQPA